MKLKGHFISQETAEGCVLVSVGDDFHGLVRLNRTAGFIVSCLKEETTAEKITDAMFEKYDAPREKLADSVNAVLEKLRSIQALDE